MEDHTDAIRDRAPTEAARDDAVYAALKAKRASDERFDFTASVNSIWDAWHPVLIKAGVELKRAEIEATFDRLVIRRLVVETEGRRSGKVVYAPAPEDPC